MSSNALRYGTEYQETYTAMVLLLRDGRQWSVVRIARELSVRPEIIEALVRNKRQTFVATDGGAVSHGQLVRLVECLQERTWEEQRALREKLKTQTDRLCRVRYGR